VLAELRIRDFAIMDVLNLPFGGGLNVLTGETGAGKSIIVGALSVLVGERASTDVVRTGAEKATVEGVFDLRGRDDIRAMFDARGIDVDDGTVVLKREIGSARTRAWANGSPVTAGVLAELGRVLVNIHGQHDAQSLLDPAAQRHILDAFAGAEDHAREVRAAFDRVSALEKELNSRDARRKDARTREDWLRHVVREIGDARLQPGEDATLADEMRRLSHAEELRRVSSEAAMLIDGDADAILARLGSVRKALVSLQKIDPSLARLDEAHGTAYYQLQELARELAAYADSAESDPARLATIERRRDVIFRLARKYGGSEESALQQLDSAQRELALIDDAGAGADSLDRELAGVRTALGDAAERLTAARKKGAGVLAADVEGTFPELGLDDGRFTIELRPLDVTGGDGAEDVEFTVALNVGHAPRPLARIASGGELSRVMLALKTILARLDRVPTLVFDEVDAGIGGAVGSQVGDAMRRVAEHHQVFAITHLPQIAARATHHIVVSKDSSHGVTTGDTRVVEDDDRVRELARMLGGDPDSPVSREHARELITAAGSPRLPRTARTRAPKSGRR
jgi:DNA repair protein RecN (Recombination protein N)